MQVRVCVSSSAKRLEHEKTGLESSSELSVELLTVILTPSCPDQLSNRQNETLVRRSRKADAAKSHACCR